VYELKPTRPKFLRTSIWLIQLAVDIAVNAIVITGVAAGILLASAPWLFG
jgi:hypothetical protein